MSRCLSDKGIEILAKSVYLITLSKYMIFIYLSKFVYEQVLIIFVH